MYTSASFKPCFALSSTHVKKNNSVNPSVQCFALPPPKKLLSTIRKYSVLNPFAKERLEIATTVTTDVVHLENWVKEVQYPNAAVIAFDVNTIYLEEKKFEEEKKFLNTLAISVRGKTMIYQSFSGVHGGDKHKFKPPPWKLIHYMSSPDNILVGYSMKDEVRINSLINVFGRRRELLHVKDLVEDFAGLGIDLSLGETVGKMLGIKPKCYSDWKQLDLCQAEDEELVKYVAVMGQIQCFFGKIYL